METACGWPGWDSSTAFSGQSGGVVSPASSGSSPGPPPSGTCRRHPHQQRLYSELSGWLSFSPYLKRIINRYNNEIILTKRPLGMLLKCLQRSSEWVYKYWSRRLFDVEGIQQSVFSIILLKSSCSKELIPAVMWPGWPSLNTLLHQKMFP